MVALHGWQPLVARATTAPTETADQSLESLFIVSTSPFAALATLFWLARLYSRVVPKVRLYWDDYLISLSWVGCRHRTENNVNQQQAFSITGWGVGLGIEHVTGARHIQFIPIPAIEKGVLYFFVTQYFTMYSNLLTKAAICTMLLRIMQSRTWRIGLWATLTSLAVMAITVTFTNTLECSPVSEYWSIPGKFEHCWSTATVTNVGMFVGGALRFRSSSKQQLTKVAYFALTDLVLALLPLVFIRQLRRPLRDKIVLAMLMGCGLVATSAGIVKLWYTHRAAHETDIFYESMPLAIFTFVHRPS
jgi:hypothetical protein